MMDIDDVLQGGGPTEFGSELTIDERAYGESHRALTQQAICKSGFEAIAFYSPIHACGADHWGIYIHEQTFFGACAEVSTLLGGASWGSIVSDMLHVINQHEVFHAAVELFSLVVEDFARFGHEQQCSAIEDSGSDLPEFPCAFQMYFQNEYQPAWPNDSCIEEKLATAYQMGCRFRTPGFKRALARLLRSALPAYTNWESYKTMEAKTRGVQELIERILKPVYKVAIFNSKMLDATTFWFPDLRIEWVDSKGPIPRRVYHPDIVRPARFRLCSAMFSSKSS
jgi:hypothetical protein